MRWKLTSLLTARTCGAALDRGCADRRCRCSSPAASAGPRAGRSRCAVPQATSVHHEKPSLAEEESDLEFRCSQHMVESTARAAVRAEFEGRALFGRQAREDDEAQAPELCDPFE